MKVADLVRALEEAAPLAYAEEWDNVGLLAGDPNAAIARVMVAIDCTREVIDEAARAECQAIVAYHPAIFRPMTRVTRGSIAYELVRRDLALYSPHTALDAADGGTNDVLADAIGMKEETRRAIRAAKRSTTASGALLEKIGMGRIGAVASIDRAALVARVKEKLAIDHVLVAGPTSGEVTRVAVCAGSAGDLLDAAIALGAQAIVTGEVRHHDALGAAARGVTVICALHSNSERIALLPLAARLRAALAGVDVSLSRVDRDPFAIA